jgi:hypothetical protein
MTLAFLAGPHGAVSREFRDGTLCGHATKTENGVASPARRRAPISSVFIVQSSARGGIVMTRILMLPAAALLLGLAACNPYDPGERALGGGLIGAASGAAVGAALGGGTGAAVGAATGAVVGAITGAATTPPPPAQQAPPPYSR